VPQQRVCHGVGRRTVYQEGADWHVGGVGAYTSSNILQGSLFLLGSETAVADGWHMDADQVQLRAGATGDADRQRQGAVAERCSVQGHEQ